ncbi:hypothetical protein [Megalodesulfovibrio paquesii]
MEGLHINPSKASGARGTAWGRRIARVVVLVALLLLLWVATLAGMARAGEPAATLQQFRFFSEQKDAAVVVRVEYNHDLLGWVHAGEVAFRDSGAVVLTIRGEPPRLVGDLAQALTAVIRRRGADAMLGPQLAARIERYKPLP